jgi:hypothetical protein
MEREAVSVMCFEAVMQGMVSYQVLLFPLTLQFAWLLTWQERRSVTCNRRLAEILGVSREKLLASFATEEVSNILGGNYMQNTSKLLEASEQVQHTFEVQY